MSIKKTLKQIRNNYVLNQVHKAKLPDFSEDAAARFRYTFSGRVQKVGFRLELSEMAKRLGLTGYCKNLENGDVLAEIQGAENKINYLVSFMSSLIRIKITDKTSEKLETAENEETFSIVYKTR